MLNPEEQDALWAQRDARTEALETLLRFNGCVGMSAGATMLCVCPSIRRGTEYCDIMEKIRAALAAAGGGK